MLGRAMAPDRYGGGRAQISIHPKSQSGVEHRTPKSVNAHNFSCNGGGRWLQGSIVTQRKTAFTDARRATLTASALPPRGGTERDTGSTLKGGMYYDQNRLSIRDRRGDDLCSRADGTHGVRG